MGKYHEELSVEHHDPLIRTLHQIIRLSIKFLAILMMLLILASVLDVVYVFYNNIMSDPVGFLTVNEIFQLFGTFMVVLIAVEIFINIRLYLGTHIMPVQLVIATALMAIARKVIVLDLDKVSYMDVIGIAAVVLALGITYWLVARLSDEEKIVFTGDEVEE